MRDDPVERVARVIAQHFYDPSDWNSKFCLDCARAAIAAMREPIRQLRAPLIELVIAYQDADSSAIQDTLRRARLALKETDDDR